MRQGIVPDSYAGQLESRHGALSGKTEIVDHRWRVDRCVASAPVRLWRQFLEQLILELGGQFVIDQPDEPDHPDEPDQSERR